MLPDPPYFSFFSCFQTWKNISEEIAQTNIYFENLDKFYNLEGDKNKRNVWRAVSNYRDTTLRKTLFHPNAQTYWLTPVYWIGKTRHPVSSVTLFFLFPTKWYMPKKSAYVYRLDKRCSSTVLFHYLNNLIYSRI